MVGGRISHNGMAVRHDNVECRHPAQSLLSIIHIDGIGDRPTLAVRRKIMSVNISVDVCNKLHHQQMLPTCGEREIWREEMVERLRVLGMPDIISFLVVPPLLLNTHGKWSSF